MKITIILPLADLSGGVRVVATYADCLRKRGHEVLVVSRPYKKPSLYEQVKSVVRGQGILSVPKQIASHLDDFPVKHHVIDSCRPVTDADLPDADVVIATWWETAEWVANLSKSKGAKIYFVQHHEIFDYMPKKRVEATYFMPLHKITVSRWLLNLMQTKYSDHNVSFVPNSVDTEQFYAPPRNKQRVPTIGTLYGTAYWKGCDTSLKAFSLAAKEVPSLRLVAFGAPISNELPLPKGTQYFCRPPQAEIRNIYASCDAWLFSSRSEGFGLPILEAMACRTPVVGTPVGAAPELIAKGGGILVDREDPEAVKEVILKICELSDLEWQKMSEAAYAVATHYTWDDATNLFEAALYKAVERSRQSELSVKN